MPSRNAAPTPRVTSHDVAARAGVSQATVSLVLSGNPRARVAKDTRARVRRAAEELGYRPNLVARGLVRRRSYAIGVVVPDLSNPFFTDVVSGVERVAAEEGYAVLLCDARETTAGRHVETLRARLVDGVIIDSRGADSITSVDEGDLNVVVVDELETRWPGVASAAGEAGRLAARHLLELGHREIGFMGPAGDVYAFRRRERGFVAELRAAGVDLVSERFRRVPATVAGGLAAMRALLALRGRPTAVFCVNDLLALGALKAGLAAGVAIPGELSLMGCDDVEMSRVVTPELTTVSVPARELGARAARLLIRRVEGNAAPARAPRELPVRLRARGTTAPAPGGRQ
jgi:DNA-binding LacI/PurR family transcriptional regulator